MTDAPRHIRARQWRDDIGISQSELAKRIGYTARAIRNFESGETQFGPVSDRSWQRYAMACQAYAGLDKLPF